MIYVGGARMRLIRDNMVNDLEYCLGELGWFDNDRNHDPVSVIGESLDPSEEIKPNIVGITLEDVSPAEVEMGGDHLEESTYTTFVDIFAENGTIGLHLAGDVFDLLRGKFRNIKPLPLVDVFDLSQDASPTPVPLFKCYYEEIELERSREWDKPYNKFWWTISLNVVDYYSSGDGLH